MRVGVMRGTEQRKMRHAKQRLLDRGATNVGGDHLQLVVARASARGDAIMEAAKARDWNPALGWADSFDRFRVFLRLAPSMTLDERRAALTQWWDGCDGIWT